LEHGFDGSGWNDFREGAQELVDRVTLHLQKEEMGILRKLHLFFASATDRQLANQYAEQQAP
jgi:hypothetical protein